MPRRVIVVSGVPASVNAPTAKKDAWKRKIRDAARMTCKGPWNYKDLRAKIQFFHNKSKLRDADNISKVVCDALQGIAYNNDNQVVDRRAEIKPIRGPYEIVGVNARLVKALVKGEDFVAITIERVGKDATKI